ncbi:TonB-dependent receptor domain-containing protein [Mucilaginibacter sp.]|uniref:TonB-dependent receptor domain-containing protein n=1 Tax=Mucilaginibacter sp. TaxID=1882438 RepID=UPI003B008C1E
MKLLSVIILFLFSVPVSGQNIRGNITSNQGEPLSNISVKLEGTTLGTRTTENGDFTLKNLKPGTYTLVASGVGYFATKHNLVVVSGRNSFLTLELDKATQLLSEVVVGGRKNRQRDMASSMAARLPLANIENPQTINTVSNQVITEQAATDFPSVVRNLPGVVKQWSSVSPYYSSRGFNTRNYVRNGVDSYSTSDLDPVNVEQMQAVKGPSGTLFTSSLVSFGGLLNRITKKPFDSTRVEIGYQAGSYGLGRFTADLNTPLNKEKTVLFRITAAQHYEGSFQDAGFIRSTFVAPSVLYKVDDRLTLSLEAEFFAREGTSLQQIAPIGFKQPGGTKPGANNPSELFTDYKRSYSNNSVTLKDPNQSFYGQVIYKLSDRWVSQTNLVRTWTQNTGNYLTFNLLKGDSLLVRSISNYTASQFTISQIEQNFTGDFKIGRLRNRLVLGLDFYQFINSSSSNALNGRAGRKAFDTLSVKHAMPNYELISPNVINSKLNGLIPAYTSSKQNTYSVYASDVLNLTNRLSAMLSLRVDRFNNTGTTNLTTDLTTGKYDQTALAPKLGLVYEIIKDKISLFGNYTSGFQNVAPVTQPDGTVSTFKPQYGNQLEGGIKADLAQDWLNATVSYYDIKVENTLRPDIGRPTYTVQEGAQYSKGVEADLFSRPVTGLLLSAGFAYNNSLLTSADATVNNQRPVNSGPAKTANWYASYTVPAGQLNGLGGGLGGNYYDRVLIINNTVNGQFYTNAYTLLNAALFYNKPKYRVGFNLDNLANKQNYYGGFGFITPGMLRRFMMNMAIRF